MKSAGPITGNRAAGITSVVEALTGTPAETFETTARRYAALPLARQSLRNRLRAFAKFNLTPFCPGYNFDKLDSSLRLPVPQHATLAIEDVDWRQTHAAQMARPPASPASPFRLVAGQSA